MFSIDGLASGLDTSAIVQGLLEIQQSQIDRYNTQKQEIITEQTSFKGIEARALTFQSAANKLASFTNNVFSVRTASSSDESIVTAAASGDAATGLYRLRVSQLARAEQLASAAFTSSESLITQGQISFQVGNRPDRRYHHRRFQ